MAQAQEDESIVPVTTFDQLGRLIEFVKAKPYGSADLWDLLSKLAGGDLVPLDFVLRLIPDPTVRLLRQRGDQPLWDSLNPEQLLESAPR